MVFDLRQFSLEDLFGCSADVRVLGDTATDASETANRIVSFLYEHLLTKETKARQCALVRLFLTRPLSSLAAEDRGVVSDAIGAGALPDTVCLSLAASRGSRPEWDDPKTSRRHRLIPLVSRASIAKMPMVSGLMSQLGATETILSNTSTEHHGHAPLFNVFHVEDARGSPLVPDQADFVEAEGIRSVLGFGGVLPPSQVFVVIVFATVSIPKWTAELFRTLAPSIGLAMLPHGYDARSVELQRQGTERILRHHEEVATRLLRELRDTAEALDRSLAERQRFMALVENSPDFIGITSPSGRGIYLNPAGRRMVGLSPTFDMTKSRIADFYSPSEGARMEELILEATRTEGRSVRDAVLRHWRTGAGIPVSEHAFTIRETGTDHVLGIGTVIRDMTEKRRADEERERLLVSAQAAREEAQAASRAKDDFLASLGHELRNPLAPILTAIELMRLRGVRSREQEIIERQAIHLARLVDDLLDVARIARGKLTIQKRLVEVAPFVARAVEAISPNLERRRQRLTVRVPEKGLLVNADADRMAQIVSNLLANASKYSDPGTEIEITVERVGTMLRLRVLDHGIGIPVDRLGTIFESFVQGTQTAELPSSGLGLGLSIVRSLVELHDGKVSARSEGPGRGSEFVVELPLAAPAATSSVTKTEKAPRRQPCSAVGARRRPTKRILVVDDNEDAATVLADALTEMGHTVVVATESRSALDLARSFRPEIALLDIGLPVLDGYELARELRALPEVDGDMRLVALTGYGQQSDRRRALEAGFAAHLIKPVALDALLDAVGETPESGGHPNRRRPRPASPDGDHTKTEEEEKYEHLSGEPGRAPLSGI